MKLKAFYAKKEDIPEEYQALYVQQSDGRYKIDADDVEDVTGLKSALEHEREERRSVKAKNAELLELLGDTDPDTVKELIASHKKGERKKAIDEDKIEEHINQELERRLTKVMEKHAGELEGVTKERDTLKSRLEVELIENALKTEAARAGVLPDALTDVVRRGRDRFKLQDNQVVAMDADGKVLYGSDGKSSQTPTEFMDELKAGARHLFQPSKGGGANRDFNSGTSGAGQGQQTLRGVDRMRAAHASDG
jgi:hypothetical protein